MSALETVKRLTERMTGWGRPESRRFAALVRQRKPHPFFFEDDGIIPNHPRWPLIMYRGALRFPDDLDPAAVLEDLFERHG